MSDSVINMVDNAVKDGDIAGLEYLLSNNKITLTNTHLKVAIRNNDLIMVQFLIDNEVRALVNPNKSNLDESFEAIELAYRLGHGPILQALEDKGKGRAIGDLTSLDFTLPARITDEIYERVRIKLIQENNPINVEVKITELLIDYINL